MYIFFLFFFIFLNYIKCYNLTSWTLSSITYPVATYYHGCAYNELNDLLYCSFAFTSLNYLYTFNGTAFNNIHQLYDASCCNTQVVILNNQLYYINRNTDKLYKK